MAQSAYPAVISEMLEQVKNMTAEQADVLGTEWTSEEGLSYDPASLLASGWFSEIPRIQNLALQRAWQRISSVASVEGRADELDAAVDAEKAAEHAVRDFDIEPTAKAGAVEAARSAVLAVGVRDTIEDAAFQLLVGPWMKAFGAL